MFNLIFYLVYSLTDFKFNLKSYWEKNIAGYTQRKPELKFIE